MKHFIFIFSLICVLFSSCSNDVDDVITRDVNNETINVTFTPTFNESYTHITRAGSNPNISDVYVYEIVNGTTNILQHYNGLQPISLNLTYGHHELRFVATNSDAGSLTDNIMSWTKIRETFIATKSIDVVAGLESQSITLDRDVAKLSIVMTDVIPDNAGTVEITCNKHNSINVPSLKVTDLENSSVVMTFPTSWYGSTNSKVEVWTLTDSEESYTTDVTLKFLDTSSNIISYFTIPNVTIKHNTNTILTGSVFNRNTGMALDFNQDWEEAINITF